MSGLQAIRVARGGLKEDVKALHALAFDGQTVNFTLGNTIVGGTSGATGILEEQTDAGASGTLILSNVVGEFVNNDVLTDSPGSGDGDATGATTVPLLTPDDELILQIDAVDMTKAEALEALSKIRHFIHGMDFPSSA